jgi:NACalpha-BTF3-like transcription factor
MIPNAEKFLKEVESGKEITAQQRRHIIAYYMATQPAKAADTQGLSEFFQVSDTMIRKDKRIIREEKAAMIKEDDVGLVIADIRIQFENQIRDLEKGKKQLEKDGRVGTTTYLQYCKTIMELELKTTEALQSLGYYPKNLGTQTTKKFSFVAVVDNKDGSVQVQNEEHVPVTVEGEFVDPYEEERRALDEEFADRPALPAPVTEHAKRTDSTSTSGTAESDPKTKE